MLDRFDAIRHTDLNGNLTGGHVRVVSGSPSIGRMALLHLTKTAEPGVARWGTGPGMAGVVRALWQDPT